MFHSGMGIMPALIMGTIISALIGFASQDIRGFIFPMVFFLLAALHDFNYEQKELLKEEISVVRTRITYISLNKNRISNSKIWKYLLGSYLKIYQ